MAYQACTRNQAMATGVIDRILSGRQTVYQLTDQQGSRLVVCGACPTGKVDSARARRAFRRGVDLLIEKIDRYDEWGPDPELQHKFTIKQEDWTNG